MKPSQILAVGAAALLGLSSAQADVTIHITGATAFRASAVSGIVSLMGGAANCKQAYRSTGSGSGANAGASLQCVIQGTIAAVPTAGVVTVKCSWSGSAGGVKTLVADLDVTTWMSANMLGGAPGSNVGIPEGTAGIYALAPGESAKADIAFSDASQVSTGYTSTSLVEARLGVIPFEWVVGSTSATAGGPAGTPSPITNVTPLLAQAVLSGGAPLSQFTGNPADTSAVYALGRDFDSGTRISALAETGVGVFGSVQHIQPTTTGTLNNASAQITELKLWPAATLLDLNFPIGNSGFNSGSTMADHFSAPGAAQAIVTGGSIPPAQQVLFGQGQLIGYLARNDASRAVRTTPIANNTAHRLTFNGVKIWNDPITGSTGNPASYNDNLIREGIYQCWEYEYISWRTSFGTTSPEGLLVAEELRDQIIAVDAATAGILLGTMNVSKTVEGGVITHL